MLHLTSSLNVPDDFAVATMTTTTTTTLLLSQHKTCDEQLVRCQGTEMPLCPLQPSPLPDLCVDCSQSETATSYIVKGSSKLEECFEVEYAVTI